MNNWSTKPFVSAVAAMLVFGGAANAGTEFYPPAITDPVVSKTMFFGTGLVASFFSLYDPRASEATDAPSGGAGTAAAASQLVAGDGIGDGIGIVAVHGTGEPLGRVVDEVGKNLCEAMRICVSAPVGDCVIDI